MKSIHRGFTLIELIIVTAIIAILASVAYPSYTKYLVRSNRTAAQAQMLDLANRQQQYLLANRAYATKTQLSAGYGLPSQLSNVYSWDITVGTSTVPSFTVTFTGIGSQASDGALTFTHDGVKGPTGKW